MQKKLSFIFFSLLILFPKISSASKDLKVQTNVLTRKADEIYEKMTLQEKVGQLFILGFSGRTIDKDLKRKIKYLKPGAIITFKRNIQSPLQISKLNSQAQKYSKKITGLPLLIMIDQEGGIVTRIKTRPTPPSALALGQTQNLALIEETGFLTGEIIRLLGFNMNLAPVLDLSNPNQKNFIGSRSFGNEPSLVMTSGYHFSRGLVNANILPTYKHFPGHGRIIHDSHHTLPIKNLSVSQIKKNDLIPFSYVTNKNIPSAMMIAHIAFPKIEPTGIAATYSKKIITDLLKDEMGYKGLILTDDLEMAGAKQVGNVGERAIRSFNAGADMIMVAWTYKKQRQAIKHFIRAVKNGRVSKERLKESVTKIIISKLNFVPANKALNLNLRKKLFKRRLQQLRNVTHSVTQENLAKSLGGYSSLRGSLSESKRVTVFSADPLIFKQINSTLSNPVAFTKLRKNNYLPISYEFKRNPTSIGLFYVTGEGTAKIANNLNNNIKSKIHILNSFYPAAIKNPQSFKSVIHIHSKNYLSGKWLAQFLKDLPLRSPASQSD